MLSPEQMHAIRLFARGENVFLSGSGGTGKSFVVKHMYKLARLRGKSVAVCAMTGIAAAPFRDCDARTLHAWSGIQRGEATPARLADTIRRAGGVFVPSVRGHAWITAESTLHFAADDPYRTGLG